MDLPSPCTVFFFVLEQTGRFGNQTAEYVYTNGEIRAPDQRGVILFDDRFYFVQMLLPARCANHHRDTKRGQLLNVAHDCRRGGELDCHVDPDERFVAIYVDARRDREAVFWRE